MGVKNLNKFLRETCKNDSIRRVNLSELSGKKIAIDVSIYLYKYQSQSLIENIYSMLSIFYYYKIIPIFIFDGKPPTEKTAVLKKRKQNKLQAEAEYNLLKIKLQENKNILVQDKQEIEETMQMLKKQFVYIKKNQITKVKELISSYGAMYFEAEGEADSLCAQLVIENKVWACLSEDMDMFVYGANRVLRYLSLINHTVVLYDMEKLLNELDITQQELREICVLSGNDYSNVEDVCENKLRKVLKFFKKYCLVEQTQKDTPCEKYGFYKWLMKTKNNLIQDWESLVKITKIFELEHEHDQGIENNLTTVSNYMENFNGKMDKPLMQYILSEDGFIFP